MEIVTEEVITDAEALEIVEKKMKEKELKYAQKNAFDALKKFVKVDSKKVKQLVEELKTLNLRDRQAVAIANFLPEDEDDLRVILQKEYSNFKDEERAKILEAVKRV